MEKNVFYIEKEKMLRSMFEIAFKQKNERIYTIDTISENYYLLDDLKPTVIIFDIKTVGKDLEKILTYGDGSILVATGDSEDAELVKNRVKNFILKPIPATNLVKAILAFID